MKKKNSGYDDIISLSNYRGQMTWSALKHMEAYWEGLRHGRTVPLRTDVDPRGIENVLEYAFILERVAPGLARFRLAGMHLVDLIGMEVRGMPLTSFFVPDSRKPVSALLEDVFQGPEKTELHLIGESGFGKPTLEGRMLLLPLKSDLGDVSRILGCLVTDGKTGRTPRRFELKDSVRTQVLPNTPVVKRRPAPQPATDAPSYELPASKTPVSPVPEKGFAENKQPFTGIPGVAHLRLVKSDDKTER